MLRAIPATLMRGGTSKGLYFHSRELPRDRTARDRALLAAMGSPDARQIDGVGGAHPLTSKVAVIGPATRADADVDYLFRLYPDLPITSAGVSPQGSLGTGKCQEVRPQDAHEG